MVATKKKGSSTAASLKKKQQQRKQQEAENNNDADQNENNTNNQESSEIENHEQLPVLPTRMEVRRARINEKKKRKEVRNTSGVSSSSSTKKEFSKKGVVVRDTTSGDDSTTTTIAAASNPFSAGSLLAAAVKSKKLKSHSKLIQKLNAATHLKSRTETTSNLSDKQREKIFVSEIQNIQKVQNNPVFQSDPLGSLQQHLQGTARMLQAPNPECRREPLPEGMTSNRPAQRGGWGNNSYNNNYNNNRNNNNNNNQNNFNRRR